MNSIFYILLRWYRICLLYTSVRYAQKSIALQIKKKDGFLIISVEDDGIGFVDTEEKVTEPFDHKNPQDDLKHFGPVSYTHLDVYKRQTIRRSKCC